MAHGDAQQQDGQHFEATGRSATAPLRPLVVSALAVAVYAALLIGYCVLRMDGRATGILFVGPEYAPLVQEALQAEPYVHDTGYDGQFYFLVATDPLALKDRALQLDMPAYRYGRILYPALSWVGGLGNPTWIVWAMVAVNLLAIALGTWCVATWAGQSGMSPWVGLAFAAIPGVLIAVIRDLGDPLATALLIAGMWRWYGRRTGSAAAFLSLAVITRETCMLPILALALRRAAQGRYRQALEMCATGIPYLCWQLYVFSVFGRFSFVRLETGIGKPLTGLATKMQTLAEYVLEPGAIGLQGALDTLLFALLVIGLILIWRVILGHEGMSGDSAWVFAGLTLLFLFSSTFVAGYWGFLRIHAMIPLFCIVFLLHTRDRRWGPPLATLTSGSLLICASFVLKALF